MFGPRLGAALSLEAGSGPTAVGTFTVRSRAQATFYPRQDAVQWGVRLNPSWRLSLGPLTASLGHDRWLTNAASPFAGIDRLSPLARTTAAARLEGELQRWSESEALTGFVEVSVSDTGPGFPPDFTNAPVGPALSTKPDGLGLGLALSRSIVENHGGRLAIGGGRDGAVVRFTLRTAGETT